MIFSDSFSSDDSVTNKEQNEIDSTKPEKTSQNTDSIKTSSDNNQSDQVDDESAQSVFADGFPFSNREQSENKNKLKNVVFYPAGARYPPAKAKVKNIKNVREKRVDNCSSAEQTDKTQEKLQLSTHSGTEDTFSSTESKSESLPSGNTNRMIIKPKCNCTQCHVWTTESEPSTKCMYPKHEVILDSPQKYLYKNEDDFNKQVNIVSIDYSSMTKVQKQSEPKILVHRYVCY